MSSVVFRGEGAAWQTWTRPRNATMIYMLCIGSGAGGAGGSAGSPQGGGSGSIATLLIPAMLLPQTIYCLVGLGGAGGPSNSSGSSGAHSYISTVSGSTAVASLVLVSGTTVASGSAGATAAIAGTFVFGTLGIWSSVAGLPPSAGGVAATWAGLSPTGAPLCGGSSGSAFVASATGFGILAAGPFPGLGATPATGVTGTSVVYGDPTFNADPLSTLSSASVPFMPSGGTGGSASTGAGGIGGNGGAGAIGCGGGGAAGGQTTNGTGGRGGDGLIMILAW